MTPVKLVQFLLTEINCGAKCQSRDARQFREETFDEDESLENGSGDAVRIASVAGSTCPGLTLNSFSATRRLVFSRRRSVKKIETPACCQVPLAAPVLPPGTDDARGRTGNPPPIATKITRLAAQIATYQKFNFQCILSISRDCVGFPLRVRAGPRLFCPVYYFVCVRRLETRHETKREGKEFKRKTAPREKKECRVPSRRALVRAQAAPVPSQTAQVRGKSGGDPLFLRGRRGRRGGTIASAKVKR